MVKKLQFVLVAVIFFVLGVFSTSFFKKERVNPSSLHNKEISTPIQKKIIITKETIFKVPEPLLRKSKTASEIAANPQVDFFSISTKLSNFREKIYDELGTRFISYQDKHDPILMDTLNSMLKKNELWYKAYFYDEMFKIKLLLFFAFHNCEKLKPIQPISKDKTCYTLMFHIFTNGVWDFTGRGSSINALSWNNNIPYVQIEISDLGSLGKDTGLLYVVVPAPNEQMPIYYLKYQGDKLKWVQGQEIMWELTTQKDIDEISKSDYLKDNLVN